MGSRQRSWNIGNLLVLLLFFGLGLTFVLPHVTATRVARIEAQAEEMTAQLLAAGIAQQPLLLEDPTAGERLLAAMTNPSNAARLSVVATPGPDLEPGIYLESKHHDFLVTHPRPASPGEPTPIEVYSWPNSTLAPTSTAFFFPQDGPAMYTHNLRARYAGFDCAPRSGSGRAHSASETFPSGHISANGERWIRLPARAAAPQ